MIVALCITCGWLVAFGAAVFLYVRALALLVTLSPNKSPTDMLKVLTSKPRNFNIPSDLRAHLA